MDIGELDFLRARRCAPQWLAFLQALAAEFQANLSVEDLRGLMRRIGERFATLNPIPRCETVGAMEVAMNAIWVGMDWGSVTLREDLHGLYIEHSYSPLVAAFGEEHLEWTPAFLEGAYEAWLTSQGAEALRVVQSEAATAAGSAVFVLSK
jgi:hypothetical protein